MKPNFIFIFVRVCKQAQPHKYKNTFFRTSFHVCGTSITNVYIRRAIIGVGISQCLLIWVINCFKILKFVLLPKKNSRTARIDQFAQQTDSFEMVYIDLEGDKRRHCVRFLLHNCITFTITNVDICSFGFGYANFCKTLSYNGLFLMFQINHKMNSKDNVRIWDENRNFFQRGRQENTSDLSRTHRIQ